MKQNWHTKKTLSLLICSHPIIFVAGVVGISLLGTRGCNIAFNNRTIETPAYHFISRATGLSGHVEYTSYTDGSQDVKIYPGLGHRFFDSLLYQDLNGDGLVDRIRQNGAEWELNCLDGLYIREFDYDMHREEFDEADVVLGGLIEEYNH